MDLLVKRLSDSEDRIPVMVSERLVAECETCNDFSRDGNLIVFNNFICHVVVLLPYFHFFLQTYNTCLTCWSIISMRKSPCLEPEI